jgi:hypothetical protein
MTISTNFAAWQLAAKGDLDVKEAPMYEVIEDEILIKVSSLPSPFNYERTNDPSVE